MCLLRDNPGKLTIVIHSKEGTLQGDVFRSANYPIAMLPLAEKMRAAIPRTFQPCFADDSASGGAVEENTACLKYLRVHRSRYGYFPSPEKSWYICKDMDEPRAQEAFDEHNLPIQMTRVHQLLEFWFRFAGSLLTIKRALFRLL